ncbi:MAG: hypothetical protein DRJ40_09780 [Thermoprotei archaeon]|nr:MAG: hypothetical protein DRJ40_09780 [Thermoprotei archaeon]
MVDEEGIFRVHKTRVTYVCRSCGREFTLVSARFGKRGTTFKLVNFRCPYCGAEVPLDDLIRYVDEL